MGTEDILSAEIHNTLESGRSFSFRHRFYRASWNIVWLLLASWTPPQLHGWRRILLRIYGAKIARSAGVYGSARIWYPANLEMGSHSFIGPRVICYCMAKVTMGPYSIVSQGAHICGGTHDIEDRHFQLIVRPIRIGARSWIAAEAFVGPGVTVGDGAVLGARGVAFKDLKPWTVYSGNPARPMKDRKVRFSESVGRVGGIPEGAT